MDSVDLVEIHIVHPVHFVHFVQANFRNFSHANNSFTQHVFSQNLLTLEFDRVIALIALEAKSTPGREALERKRPYQSIEACERAQGELAEMSRFYLAEGQLPLAGLTDVAPLLHKELLEFSESWLVLRAARATQAVRETFLRAQNPYPYVTRIAKGIDDLGPLVSSIARYFGKDGKLREEASAELRTLRTRIQSKRSAIQKTLFDVMNRHADAIQESIITLRGDRYCVPVRADHRSAVAGILHERSGSGASFFIEPMAVVELNNDLADLLMQEREEIARITRFVSKQLLDSRDAILASVEVAGELDALQACAIIENMIGGTRPTFTTTRNLELLDARHPLLDERLADMRRSAFGETPRQDERVIATTLSLSDDHPALVISGPNAGGKTVALKTAGLLVAMAASGLPFPAAEGSVVPVVDHLHVLIGDDQSLLDHLSTFSAYLVRLKRVVEHVTEHSLVLLDELGSGTDPEEGSALAAATIEHIVDRGALLIVTTHLSSLKSFAIRDSRVAAAAMEFDAVSGRPSFRLIAGIPGRSRAIDVAQMIGLPAGIVSAARAKLGSEQQELDQLVAQIQKTMQEVTAEREEAARIKLDLARREEAIATRDAQLKEEKQKLASHYRDELQRLEDDVHRALQIELRRLREADRVEREKAKPTAIAESLVQPLAREDESMVADERPIAVGERVEHRRFRVSGEVVSIDGKRVVLNVSGKKMEASLEDLRSMQSTKPSKQEKSSRVSTVRTPSQSPQRPDLHESEKEPSIGGQLNLIGQRVDDALDESDKFLDQSLLAGTPAVRLIHGFGSGALRKAVREHLRKHPAVRSFRPAKDNEGGDGATVVFLDV